MGYQDFKTNFLCVGDHHQSETISIEVLYYLLSLLNVTGKQSRVIGDKTIQAERLGNFNKKIGKASAKTGKSNSSKITKNVAKAIETGGKNW